MDVIDILLDIRVISLFLGTLIPLLIYRYSTRTFDYWKRKGIPYVKPYPFVGSFFTGALGKNYEDAELERYSKYGRIYGFFEGMKPTIVVAEPDLVKNIFVKDFQYFSTRRITNTGDIMLDKMMSLLRGDDWKRVRTIISPTFSTGKIKRLINIFKESSKSITTNYTEKEFNSIDVLKVYGAFTMDVIASSAFSTKLDTYRDTENEFVKHAKAAFGLRMGFGFFLYLLMPRLMKLLKVKILDPTHMDFFRSVTLEIIKERKRTGEKRNDFLQLVMDAAEEEIKEEKTDDKQDNIISNYGEDSANHEVFKTSIPKHLSMDELVANCVAFFIGGYHTTATTLSMATYFLALNPDIQNKLFLEITDVLKDTHGELTYEAVQKMKFLDNIISEALRIFSPVIRLDRTAEADYELGNTGIIIPKGMVVGIPIYSMHRDPKFFPDPLTFNPNRFSTEEKEHLIPYSFLPFGAGPRNCVGMRFALVEMKVCLAYVFSHFCVKTCPDTSIPLEFIPASGLLQPKSIVLKLEPRNNNPLKM